MVKKKSRKLFAVPQKWPRVSPGGTAVPSLAIPDVYLRYHIPWPPGHTVGLAATAAGLLIKKKLIIYLTLEPRK